MRTILDLIKISLLKICSLKKLGLKEFEVGSMKRTCGFSAEPLEACDLNYSQEREIEQQQFNSARVFLSVASNRLSISSLRRIETTNLYMEALSPSIQLLMYTFHPQMRSQKVLRKVVPSVGVKRNFSSV